MEHITHSRIDEIHLLSLSEEFIPFVIQLIFYDKLLQRYSLHHYRVHKIIVDDVEEYYPVLKSSSALK